MVFPSFFQDPSRLVDHLQKSFPSRSAGLIIGEFDFFNAGHRLSLEAAKGQCDLLVVALHVDQTIQAFYGRQRPFQSLPERAEMLLGTQYVDYVLALSTPADKVFHIWHPQKILEMISPNSSEPSDAKVFKPSTIEQIPIALDEKEATAYAISQVLEKLKMDASPPSSAYAGFSPELPPHPAIIPLHNLSSFLLHQRQNKNALCTTNGSFDLLHPGHLRYLQQAKKLGHTLVVLVNDDVSIRKAKGDQRPIFNQRERCQALAMLECVDFVIPFTGDTPLQSLAQIQPQLHVKGGSFEPERIAAEKRMVESHGGHFHTFDLIDEFSSTNLLARISQLYQSEKS